MELSVSLNLQKVLLGVPFYTRDWQVQIIRVSNTSVLVTDPDGAGIYQNPGDSSECMHLPSKSIMTLSGEDAEWFHVKIQHIMYFLAKNKGIRIPSGTRIKITNMVTPVLSKDIPGMINKVQGTLTFDEQTEQRKLRYTDHQNQQHEVWIEDSETMGKRMDIVLDFDLAGTAAWALNQENPGMWQVIKQKLKTS
jgi:spore germination protein YaaH